jgi:hypothetical protein
MSDAMPVVYKTTRYIYISVKIQTVVHENITDWLKEGSSSELPFWQLPESSVTTKSQETEQLMEERFICTCYMLHHTCS